MVSFLECLTKSPRGLAWLSVLPQECLTALTEIETMLDEYWTNNLCVPSKLNALSPPCKEPYSNKSMLNSVSVEVASANKMQLTDSERAFMAVIRKYW